MASGITLGRSGARWLAAERGVTRASEARRGFRLFASIAMEAELCRQGFHQREMSRRRKFEKNFTAQLSPLPRRNAEPPSSSSTRDLISRAQQRARALVGLSHGARVRCKRRGGS